MLIILFHRTASALEVYSFIDDKKKNYSGFVLSIDETNLVMLSLDGKLNVLEKESIASLYMYHIVQNPIKTLALDSKMAEYLRNVYLTGDENPSFTGFPIQMIDETVIFFDLDGRIHVQELSDIVKLRQYDFKENRNLQLSDYKEVLLITDNQDKQKNVRELSVYPTKIINGKLNINKYYIKTGDNFVKLNSYQERTHLYAKPLIFDQDFKMGNIFLFRKTGFKERNLMNPYVQWSTGKAYGFQSKTTIGTTDSEWIPELYPAPVIQSEVKTHFFNTVFAGNMNLAALPAGSRLYTSDGDSLTYTNSLNYSYNPYVEINFNYMLLLGGDYGPYSASLGMFYPVYAININYHVREITAAETSPAFRFIYQKGGLKIKTVISVTSYGADNGSVSKSVFARYAGGMQFVNMSGEGAVFLDDYGYSEYADDNSSPITKYKLESCSLRAGLIYDLTDDLKIGIDGIFLAGKYRENFNAQEIIAGNNEVYQAYKNSVTFRHYNAGLFLHHRFSDYVALKGIFNFYYNKYDYSFFNIADDKVQKKYEYGGAFELIF